MNEKKKVRKKKKANESRERGKKREKERGRLREGEREKGELLEAKTAYPRMLKKKKGWLMLIHSYVTRPPAPTSKDKLIGG